MRHSNEATECPSCEEKLNTADPRIAQWFRKMVKPYFHDAHISCAYRGKEAQDDAFKRGASHVKFPFSKHNHRNGFGAPSALALDLFRLGKDGKAYFPVEWYTELWHASQDDKLPMRWGGEFKRLKDYPHFELVAQ